MGSSSRPMGVVGDVLSLLGIVLMLFSGYVVWQEGITALFVTLNPSPSSYERRIGGMPTASGQDKTALLDELYRYVRTPAPNQAAAPAAAAQSPIVAPRSPEPVASPSAPAPAAPAPVMLQSPGAPPPGSEPPSRLLIPSIGVDSSVVEVGYTLVDEKGALAREWETASYAVGYHQGSALPGGAGNTVLSGHNNIQGRVFRLLERVSPGDEVFIETATGRRFRYVVREQVILPELGVPETQRRENARYMLPTADARVTLISCWPYWTNTHRVIVVAEFMGIV